MSSFKQLYLYPLLFSLSLFQACGHSEKKDTDIQYDSGIAVDATTTSGDASLNLPDADIEPQTIVVEVGSLITGENRSGVTILSHDRSGAVVDRAVTNNAGVANLNFIDKGAITAVLLDPGLGEPTMVTVTDLSSQNTLHFGSVFKFRDNFRAVPLALPTLPDGTDHLLLHGPCGLQNQHFSLDAFEYLLDINCSVPANLLDLVIVAVDADGQSLGFARVNATPIDNGTIVVSSFTTETNNLSLSLFNNADASRLLQGLVSPVIQNRTSQWNSWSGNALLAVNSTSEFNSVYPTGVYDSILIGSLYDSFVWQSARYLLVDSPNVNANYTMAALEIPRPYIEPVVNPAMHSVKAPVPEGGNCAGSTPDVNRFQFSAYRESTNSWMVWVILTPPSDKTVQLPSLPDDVELATYDKATFELQGVDIMQITHTGADYSQLVEHIGNEWVTDFQTAGGEYPWITKPGLEFAPLAVGESLCLNPSGWRNE